MAVNTEIEPPCAPVSRRAAIMRAALAASLPASYGAAGAEVLWRSADDHTLLVFSTSMPTPCRIPTLMQDPQYGAQLAGRSAGAIISRPIRRSTWMRA